MFNRGGYYNFFSGETKRENLIARRWLTIIVRFIVNIISDTPVRIRS